MTTLARELRTTDYFTLGLGTMVGVGWLVVMDDWLRRGGPWGAILGFAIGGAMLLPVGVVYGRLAMAMPDAGCEIAYTERVFPPGVSFVTGWVMTLAYLVVCPWEAVAVGKIASYLFPALNIFELYRVAGTPVYLPHLLIGLGLTAWITSLNYRSIRSSADFQNWTTFGLLALFLVFAFCGLSRGSIHNFRPPFGRSGWVSTLLVLQIVPYFMTGFESIPKCAEESSPRFSSQGYLRAMLMAIGVGIVFYTSVIAVVAYVQPWQSLIHERFATAAAFERALRSTWIVDVILAAAVVSLLKVFNGNLIASARLLLALGRRGWLNARFGQVHATNRTPSLAVLAVGVVTAATAFLGEPILVPVTEVGSLASAVGWLAASAAYYRLGSSQGSRALAAAGISVALLLILIKILPFVPGHFTLPEYLVLGLWMVVGVLLKPRRRTAALAG